MQRKWDFPSKNYETAAQTPSKVVTFATFVSCYAYAVNVGLYDI